MKTLLSAYRPNRPGTGRLRRITGTLTALLLGMLSLASLSGANVQAAPASAGILLTYPVTNTNDSGANSLRQAIINANGNVGLDTISFNIPGGGVHSIALLSPLPPIVDPVLIDGYSQPGSSCNTLPIGINAVPQIELNGSSVAGSGLVIVAGGSTVKGLIINRFGVDGIDLQGTGGNTVTGNFIGTNATGTAPSPNVQRGILVETSNNSIGTALPCDRNLISSNAFNGVHINTQGGTNNTVYNNYIGTDINGTSALPNNGAGVLITSASSNFVGNATQGTGNVISGNEGTGVIIQNNGQPATLNRVRGNLIGTKASGSGALGNTRWGVMVIGTGQNQIGGTAAGAGNTIAYNMFDGVMLVGAASIQNPIRTNSIHDNTDLGIDLTNDGVTPNDAMDPDSGENTLQNYPILSATSTTSVVQGTFNSVPNSTFTLEFFYNTACDPSNFGEGETPDGSVSVTTDAAGNATFSYTLPVVAPSGSFLTATATDASGNTSEFSHCQLVQGTPTATPTLCPNGLACTPTSTTTPTQCSAPCATATPTCQPGVPCSTDTPTPTATCGAVGCATPTPTCPQGQLCGTSTSTSTNTPTSTNTNTALPTNTRTNTPTSTNTPRPSNTPTLTSTPTATCSSAPCATATPTCPQGQLCGTSTPTSTSTDTPHPTDTPTCQAGAQCGTSTPTSTATATCSAAPCATATPTCPQGQLCGTSTSTNTPTKTNTPTSTNTNTVTSTPTSTSTNTPTATPTCIILGHYTATIVPATVTIIPASRSLGNSCDNCLSQVEFPFPVMFYGTEYSKAVASSNGNVQFVPESTDNSATCLPNQMLDTAILLYQGDLDTSGAGEGIYTDTIGTAPDRTFIIEWRAHYVGRSGTANAEILFYENSDTIRMVYGDNSDEGLHEVSGMQNGRGEQIDQYSCNQPNLQARKAIDWQWIHPIIICTPTPTRTPTNTPSPTPTCITAALSNGFESGTLEGYTSVVATCVPGGCGWTNVSTAAHTGTRSLFAPDVNQPSDQQLVTPAFTVPGGLPKLIFWHRYALEHPLWDGGILEISPNGGPWATITPSAISPTYPPGTIPGTFLNPLVGKQGWTDKNPSYPLFDQIIVDLSPYAGVPNTKIRWRLGTDQGNAGTGPALGWWIDDITISGSCATATPTRTNTNTPTRTPTRTITPTATPTLPCVQPPAGMTHWYPLDETSGTVANEILFGKNAFEFNAPAHVPGKVAGALNFNGINQWAAVSPPGNSPQLGSGNFTIDTWINVPASSLSGTQTFLDGRDFAPRGYAMYLVNGRLGFQMADQVAPTPGWTNYVAPTVGALATPGWHLVAVTVSRTANGGKLWVDGAVVLTFTPRMGNISSGAPLWFGRHHPNSVLNSTSFFNGSLDEVEFFERELPANVIIGLYNAGAGGKCKPIHTTPTVTPTAGPCHWCGTDVILGSPFYPYVTNLLFQRVVTGYPCGGPNEPCEPPTNYPYFRPGANITRGQIAKIVAISAGFSDVPTDQTFADVPQGQTFYTWIEELARRGLIGGYACGGPGEPCDSANRPYFRPGSNATRGQLSKIVANAAGINDDPGAQMFEDIPVGSTFYAYVNPLAQRGTVGGYACGSVPSEPCIGPANLPYFRPSSNVTRGQASKIVANTFWLDDWIEP